MILCSGTLGDVPFAAKARAAAGAGFDAVSIYAREAVPGLRPLLDDLGLGVAEVDGATAWLPGQPGPDPRRSLELAAELGARSLTVIEATGVAPDPGEAADAFARVCAEALPLGLVVHLEPFAWSGIATLALAEEVVRRAGCSNGGILLDTWHHLRGPDGGRLLAGAVPLVVAVQVSDPAPTPGPTVRDECMTDRRLPGPASAAVVRELRAAGCEAPLEVEVFGLDLAPDAAARAAFDALAALPTLPA